MQQCHGGNHENPLELRWIEDVQFSDKPIRYNLPIGCFSVGETPLWANQPIAKVRLGLALWKFPCHQAAGESENGGKRQVYGSWIQLDNWRKKVMLALNFKSISGWCRMSTYVMYKVQTEHGVILATGEVGSPSLSLRVENRTSILSFFQEEVFGWVLGGLGVVLGGFAGGCNNVLWPPVWITMSWYVETSSS